MDENMEQMNGDFLAWLNDDTGTEFHDDASSNSPLDQSGAEAVSRLVAEFWQTGSIYSPQPRQQDQVPISPGSNQTQQDISLLRERISNAMLAFQWYNRRRSELRQIVYESSIAQRIGESHESLRPRFNDVIREYCMIENGTEDLKRELSVITGNIQQLEQSVGLTQNLSQLKNTFQELGDQVQQSSPDLVKEGLLVTKSPKPVVARSPKGETRSTKDSRLRIEMEITAACGLSSRLLYEGIEVEVLLITERQSHLITQNILDPLDTTFVGVGQLQHSLSSFRMRDVLLVAEFPNVRILPSSSKHPSSDTSEEMHRFLFRTKRAQNQRASPNFLPLWVTSIPVAVVTNQTKQEMGKEAKIFWQVVLQTRTNPDDGFDSAKWPHVYHMLDFWLKRMAGVTRGLDEHQDFIKLMLFKTPTPNCETVTFQMLAKDMLPSGSGTFWELIYRVTAYLKKFPMDWENNLLHGFIDRDTLAQLVKSTLDPSLAFRFSVSSPGQIVAAFVNPQTPGEVAEILFQDSGRSLADYVRTTVNLENIRFVALKPAGRIAPVTQLHGYLPINDGGENGASRNPYWRRLWIFRESGGRLGGIAIC